MRKFLNFIYELVPIRKPTVKFWGCGGDILLRIYMSKSGRKKLKWVHLLDFCHNMTFTVPIRESHSFD
jgi:hypothetical protein